MSGERRDGVWRRAVRRAERRLLRDVPEHGLFRSEADRARVRATR